MVPDAALKRAKAQAADAGYRLGCTCRSNATTRSVKRRILERSHSVASRSIESRVCNVLVNALRMWCGDLKLFCCGDSVGRVDDDYVSGFCPTNNQLTSRGEAQSFGGGRCWIGHNRRFTDSSRILTRCECRVAVVWTSAEMCPIRHVGSGVTIGGCCS